MFFFFLFFFCLFVCFIRYLFWHVCLVEFNRYLSNLFWGIIRHDFVHFCSKCCFPRYTLFLRFSLKFCNADNLGLYSRPSLQTLFYTPDLMPQGKNLRKQLCVSLNFIQGNLKGESVVAAILPSRMEVRYCTSGFVRSYVCQAISISVSYLSSVDLHHARI